MPNETDYADQLDDLVDDIIKGNVIPVVGSDLIKICPDADALKFYGYEGTRNNIHLEDFLARKLFIDESLESDIDSESVELNNVLHALINAMKRRHPQLKIQRITQRMRRKVSSHLSQIFERFDTNVAAFSKLAQINTIKLYFNASFTSLPRNDLNRWRINSTEYDFYPHFGPIRQDIGINESDYETLDHPILYNLFGDFSLGHFLLSENDYIEFVIDYHEGRNELSNLQNLVDDPHNNRTFLFLGCSFPNWLFRFFVRALSGRKLENLGLNVVVNDTLMNIDSARTLFFNRNQITYFSDIGPEQLIENIHQAVWSRFPECINQSKTNDIVFLSYASEDKAMVHRLYEILSHNNVDVWFDDRGGINHGDKFKDMITDAMDRSAIFIPILSRNSNCSEDARYYLKEWQYALDLEARTGLKICPVIIDDLKENSPGKIPATFWERAYKRVENERDYQVLMESVKQEQNNRRHAAPQPV